MSTTPVKSVVATATSGLLISTPCRIRGVYYAAYTTSIGFVRFYDSSVTTVAAADQRLAFGVPFGTDTGFVHVPDMGIRFNTGVWATIANTSTALTVFYD